MQKHIVFAADVLYFGPIGGGRKYEPARALDRFRRKRCDAIRADLEDGFFELARNQKAEFFGIDIAIARRLGAEPVRCGHFGEAGKRQIPLRVHGREAGKRSGRHRHAVIGVFARQVNLLVRTALQIPIIADQLQGRVVRFRSRIREQHMLVTIGQNRRELGSQFGRPGVRRLEEVVVIGERFQRFVACLGKLGIAVSDLHAPEARHAVDQFRAFGIP